MEKKISFIGSGVMAEAMVKGLLKTRFTKPSNINVADPRADRVEEMNKLYDVKPFTDNAKCALKGEIIILSVKPQRLGAVINDLRNVLKPEQLLISIVAGATIEKISSGLKVKAIIRAMPNTPAQIGEGITVWYPSDAVSDQQRQTGDDILKALGDSLCVEEEAFLDMATALSGTGPAYLFLFMEAMVDAGVHLGFSRRISEQLVAKTFSGSVNFYLANRDHIHLASLRNQVTSPAGTSAAALYHLEKAGFRTAIARAVWAAFERSVDLGKTDKSKSPEPTHFLDKDLK